MAASGLRAFPHLCKQWSKDHSRWQCPSRTHQPSKRDKDGRCGGARTPLHLVSRQDSCSRTEALQGSICCQACCSLASESRSTRQGSVIPRTLPLSTRGLEPFKSSQASGLESAWVVGMLTTPNLSMAISEFKFCFFSSLALPQPRGLELYRVRALNARRQSMHAIAISSQLRTPYNSTPR